MMSDPQAASAAAQDPDEVVVRSAGAGIELRVGGTSASWYQPGRTLTGSVWDALAVPLCAVHRAAPRVLLLGLGGGSTARLIRAASPEAHIVGVERSADVVAAARADMALDALRVEVHVEDAARFLEREGSYDLIVEDCFLGGPEGLTKPPWILERGLPLIAARLAPGGVLAVDTIHEVDEVRAQLRPRYRSLVRIELFDCTNRVFVATDRELDARALRAKVKSDRILRDTLGNLTFRTVPAL